MHAPRVASSFTKLVPNINVLRSWRHSLVDLQITWPIDWRTKDHRLNRLIVLRKSWLVNPGRPIPKEAFDVHGISDEAVADAPPFAGILPELLEALSGAIPLAYNAEFDRKQLMAEMGRLPMPASLPPAFQKNVDWIDPLVWARELQKLEKSRALAEVAARLGIELTQAHRATNDAEAALNVFIKFREDSRLPKAYGAFLQEQRRLARAFENERVRWRG